MTTPLTLFAQGKLAMAVGSNYFTGNWTKFIGAPVLGAGGPDDGGHAHARPQSGGGIASTLGGWDYAISAHSGNPSAAFKLINVMENQQNSIDAANWAGWVTPNKDYWTAPAFTEVRPLPECCSRRSSPTRRSPRRPANYSIWVQGMGNATGQLVQNPSTSVGTAVNTLSSYVSNQLGSSSTEKLPLAHRENQSMTTRS